jgi:hypothetical protein
LGIEGIVGIAGIAGIAGIEGIIFDTFRDTFAATELTAPVIPSGRRLLADLTEEVCSIYLFHAIDYLLKQN